MRKVFCVICIFLLLFLTISPAYAKTTFDASIKKRQINVSDDHAKDFAIFITNYISPTLTNLIKVELMDDAIDAINRALNYKVLELVTEDKDRDGVPDIIDSLSGTIISELLENEDAYIVPIIEALRTPLSTSLGEALANSITDNNILNLILGTALTEISKLIFDLFKGDIKNLLRDFIENNLEGITDDALADLIEDLPQLLEDLIYDELPGALADLVDDEIPGLIEDLIADNMPREFEMYILSLNFKTDIASFMALGASVRGVSFDSLFIPEIELAVYFKLLDRSNINLELIINGQNMFVPHFKDVQAFNVGMGFEWTPVRALTLKGGVLIGSYLGQPFGEDTPKSILSYNASLIFNISKNVYVKASYAKEGLSDLAVAHIEQLTTGENTPGYFNFSAGFQF